MKNYYTYGYGKKLKEKKIDFMEPAENFLRVYKMNFQKKKNLNCLDFGVGDGRHTKFLLKKSNNVQVNRYFNRSYQTLKKKSLISRII